MNEDETFLNTNVTNTKTNRQTRHLASMFPSPRSIFHSLPLPVSFLLFFSPFCFPFFLYIPTCSPFDAVPAIFFSFPLPFCFFIPLRGRRKSESLTISRDLGQDEPRGRLPAAPSSSPFFSFPFIFPHSRLPSSLSLTSCLVM